MRYIVCLFVGLLVWGLADEFVVSAPQLSACASASDDDEYLHRGANRPSQRLGELATTVPCPAVLSVDRPATLSEASLALFCSDLRTFAGDCRLYVFMSLQI
jgi:hypothetical protein